MYSCAEHAFAALDFTGLGYVTKESFLNSNVVTRKLKFTVEEYETFFKSYNMFNEQTPGIILDNFKKIFFPKMYLVGEDRDDDEDLKAKEVRNQMYSAKDQQQDLIEKRLLNLDSKIKGKFSNLYDSVRKAFLKLDCDYDGYITVEEILKVIGQSTDLNYNDLKKLIIDKDRNK